MFPAIDKRTHAEKEEDILHFWEQEKIFQKSLDKNQGACFYSFYDGPPFATGLPHYGHLLASIIKDVVPRYKTMKGFFVPRRFGWDCHGLPVENEIEKEKGLKGAANIEEFGIASFNEACREIVFRYTKEWKKTVQRIGRWVDFEDTYQTMDLSFMESVWWVFSQLFEKGLVYEGYKVMPVSAQLGTPLSNFEATQNYKEVDDPSVTVAFALAEEENTYFLAWTTTPWTLISNLALCVGEEIDYVKIKDHATQRLYILAKDALARLYKKEEDYTILKTFCGKELLSKKYEPLLPYFNHLQEASCFRVIAADFVSTQEGTGIVHTAPGFGEDDFYACKAAGIDEIVCPINNNGIFSSQVPEYAGRFFKDCDKDIIRRLKEEKKLVKQSTVRHRYPFCWRSDTPLVYKAVTTWFIAVEKIKDKLLKANENIHWTPSYLKEGRFGKWLEGARDWAVSRNRYWGTPIPIWRSTEGDLHVISSVQELEELCGKKIDDLHRHFIDDLSFEKDGKVYHRVKEVFDCWFESGSMPYAQNHYPFENKEKTLATFPADFIAEGLDQTRGWFYTLTVLSAALFDKPAFKNVIVNGILLAEDGAKMSKRLRNYPAPEEVIHEYGADAVRLYLLHSPAVRAEDLCFSKRGVELSLRKILIPCWNAYVFFSTYAQINGYSQDHLLVDLQTFKPKASIDRWLISVLHALVEKIEKGMDQYNLSLAVDPFVEFIDQLTNWYIRRCRRRFWDEKESMDRKEAFQTLYMVLLELSKVAAPFIPFMSEMIYKALKTEKMPTSVHLCSYPVSHSDLRDLNLEKEMSLVQEAVSLGHSLRKEAKMKVRQPLPQVHIACSHAQSLSFLKLQKHLLAEELNVKEVCLHEDETPFVRVFLKPNFRSLGRKVGKWMPQVKKKISELSSEDIQSLSMGKDLCLDFEEQSFTLSLEDVELVREVKENLQAASNQTLTVALNTELTEDLLEEGLCREIINKVSSMRRQAQLHVADRILLSLESTEQVKRCVERFKELICSELLVIELSLQSPSCLQEDRATWEESWDLNGNEAKIRIQLAHSSAESV